MAQRRRFEQPCFRNVSQRASADHRRAARVGYCASAVGCGHCPPASAIVRGLRPPFRLFELHSAIQIRSEVSAPARLWPRNVDAIGGAFVPADFLVRAGWGYGRRRFSTSKELGCGGLCPHPLRKLSFLRTFLLLPPLRTRGAANTNAGASHYHNGAAPSLRTTSPQKRIAAGKRRPPARRPRRLLRVSSWLRALPARVSDCVQAQPAGCGTRRCGRAG